jgi:hypothetical protein
MGVGEPNDVPPHPTNSHAFAGTFPCGTATPLVGEPIPAVIFALDPRDASHACAHVAYSSESTSRYSCSTCVLSVRTDLCKNTHSKSSGMMYTQRGITKRQHGERITYSCQCDTEFPYRMGNKPGRNRFRTLSVSRTMRENRSLQKFPHEPHAYTRTTTTRQVTCSTGTVCVPRLGNEGRQWISQDV